jgi:hypothetical protein
MTAHSIAESSACGAKSVWRWRPVSGVGGAFAIYEIGTLYDFSFFFLLSLTKTTNMPFAFACLYCSFKETWDRSLKSAR